MSEPIRVLVADDHAVVREGLKLFLDLQDGIEVVGEAGDGAEAIEQAKALHRDVVLMDLVMPNTTGVEATLEIKASSPGTSVLVLTSFLETRRCGQCCEPVPRGICSRTPSRPRWPTP